GQVRMTRSRTVLRRSVCSSVSPNSTGDSAPGRVEAQGEVTRLAHAGELVPDRITLGHPVVGDSAVELVDRGAELGAGEMRAEAAVDAGGEGDVAVLGAVEIDPERAVEGRGVEIGAGPAEVHELTLLDRYAVDLGVAQRGACTRRRHRALVAHDLLDGAREAIGFRQDARPELRVGREPRHDARQRRRD